MRSRRAVVLSYYPPEADHDSGSRRMMDHVDFLLEAGWAVDFIALNGFRDERYVKALGRRGVAPHDATVTELEDLLSGCHFDLALFAFWQTAERYGPVIRRLSASTHIVVDSVDLQFLRDARRTLREPEQGLLGVDYGASFVGEINVYAAADAVLTVSRKEAGLINDLTGDPTLATAVPDVEALAVSETPYDRRNGVLFVGSFQHAPNADAVEYLCREIVPLLDASLLEKHPITIIGAGLDDSIRTYTADHPSIRAVGWVPSVVPYLEQARASVVPLRYGAGTKRKLLQTLMVGTPAVSTTVGIEGLDIHHGEQVLVADDPETFAQHLTDLLRDPALWRKLSRKGHAAIAPHHAREPVQKQFTEVVDRALESPPKPRLLTEPDQALYDERMTYLQNQKIVGPIREILRTCAGQDSTVAVISNGSSELLRLGERQAWHFPSDDAGVSIGNPASSADALDSLESIRARGAEYLILPSTVSWWREHYAEFFEAVEERYSSVAEEESCTIYRLGDVLAAVEMGSDQGIASGGTDPTHEPDVELAARAPVRLISLYLPQYHPIPENDEWWDEGFTEWTNVAGARPLFPGHHQPHVPADLGFYDLRLPETRQAQADLAREYGIHGFCYYHYWFDGKLLLERPFNEVLASGEPDFPFCLCWANEPWSRRWHGRSEDVLIQQGYGHQDDLAHIQWLLPALADPRAIHIDGRPVFIVYQARDMPEPARTVDTWREEASRAGIGDLYLMTVETGWDEGWDATEVGFDAKVMFRPQFTTLRNTPRLMTEGPDTIEVHDYGTAWPALAAPVDVSYPHFETVCPGWDNSARAGHRAVILHDSTPEAYGQWLAEVVERASRRPPAERAVFVNAWNEWAEGCHLEPDVRHGHGYLEATRAALAAAARRVARADGASGDPKDSRLAHGAHRPLADGVS